VIGIELARIAAIVGGICLAFVCSSLFLGVDARALELSRALRRRMSAPSVPGAASARATPIVAAE